MSEDNINKDCGVIPQSTILKFQRPIFQGGAPKRPDDPKDILVYDETRKIEGMLPPTDDLLRLFGEEFKFYAECFINKDGTVSIRKVVEDQPW